MRDFILFRQRSGLSTGNGLGFTIRRHFDETKALAAARIPIRNEAGLCNRAEGAELFVQILFANRVRQVTDVESLSHDLSRAKTTAQDA
jgi:hypothetical protein